LLLVVSSGSESIVLFRKSQRADILRICCGPVP
jgi:hypothetical protein